MADSKSVSSEGTLIYEGVHSSQLKRLRRISLASSVVSIFGLPLVIKYGGNKEIAFGGQAAIGASIMFTSAMSTAVLAAFCYPYVSKLVEIDAQQYSAIMSQSGGKSAASATATATTNSIENDRYFTATRLNLFGNDVKTTFRLSETQKITSAAVHPFATFRLDKKYFFVASEQLKDDSLKSLISR